MRLFIIVVLAIILASLANPAWGAGIACVYILWKLVPKPAPTKRKKREATFEASAERLAKSAEQRSCGVICLLADILNPDE